MSKFILIETATQACSVAIAEDNEILVYKELDEPKAQAAKLAPLIEQALNQAGVSPKECAAVSVSKGPGSYTGLRVGVSTAKGLCFGANIPLIGVETLTILCSEALDQCKDENTLIVPMLDARRMEVYTSSYNSKGEKITDTQAMILDENSFSEEFEQYGTIIFIGDGVEKFKAVLPEDKLAKSNFISTCPSAKHMVRETLERWNKKSHEDVAYFEPFYLKEFVAGISKKSDKALFGRD